MKTVDFPLLGKLSGRFGPMVAYVTKDGRQHFRTYVQPANPRTPRQMANRMKFGLACQSLSPLKNAIRRGYPGDEKAFHKVLGKACREAVMGEYPHFRFDYSRIEIARGDLPLPANIRMTYDPSTREARFSWDHPLSGAPLAGNDNDKIIIVCLHADPHPEVVILHASNRADGTATLPLPDRWEAAQTHFWLYLTSYDQQENSNSVHFVQ